MTKELRKNLKKPQKHTTFYQIQRENKIMIILVTQLLKMAEVAEEDLETLILLYLFVKVGVQGSGMKMVMNM